MTAGERPTRLVIACSGLDHVFRGYEASLRGLHVALRGEAALDVSLLKGSGSAGPGERALRTLPRGSLATRALARARNGSPYGIEQATFARSLLRHLGRLDGPTVLLHSDWEVGRYISARRQAEGLDVRLLLRNGGPNDPPFTHVDHVQQIAPPHLEAALRAGEPPDKHTLLPTGVDIPAAFRPTTTALRKEAKRVLGVPEDRPLVLSVAAVNASHKRADHLVREVARLAAPRPFLLLLGQSNWETPAIEQEARRLLGEESFAIRTMHHQALTGAYRAADVFAMASLREGLGRATVEAMAQGVPCILHDYDVARWVLSPSDSVVDMTREGALATRVEEVLQASETCEAQRERFEHARRQFGWDALKPRYVALARRVAAGGRMT